MPEHPYAIAVIHDGEGSTIANVPVALALLEDPDSDELKQLILAELDWADHPVDPDGCFLRLDCGLREPESWEMNDWRHDGTYPDKALVYELVAVHA